MSSKAKTEAPRRVPRSRSTVSEKKVKKDRPGSGKKKDESGSKGKKSPEPGPVQQPQDNVVIEKEIEEQEKVEQEDTIQNGENEQVTQENEEVPQEIIQENKIDPEDFNPREFLARVKDLQDHLSGSQYRTLDQDFSGEQLSEMVQRVTGQMDEFYCFSEYVQTHLDKLREQLKEIKDRMFKKINQKAYDPHNASIRQSLEERQIEAKNAVLNKELARAAEELVRAGQITTDTESRAVTATLVAEKAAEEARQIQAEYEARRKAEIEARREEEAKREAQERRRLEEEARQEERRKAEEARRARLKSNKEETQQEAKWQDWPTFTYDGASEQNGMSCIVRGDPNHFRENDIKVDDVAILSSGFKCDDNEELVGGVVNITASNGETKLPAPVQLVLPHMTSRAAAMTREPVIKGQPAGQNGWKEFRSHEVTLDGHKDMKFVQAEIDECGNYTVVTKAKRDFLIFNKRGGKIASNVDQRVTFEAERGTFSTKEHFVLQLQQVDSSTVGDVRKTEEGKGLLTSSPIVNMEWTSKEFTKPIQMTLPCPPNPVKAKKAAAARAAKEAKMKKPPPSIMEIEEEERRKKEREMEKKKKKKSEAARMAAYSADNEEAPPAPKQTKWYMGQYGNNEDDESEMLYFVRKSVSGNWIVCEDITILQPKLDLLQFKIDKPLPKFMVLRVSPDVDAKDATVICEMLERHLTEKTVNVILRQRSDSGVECCLQVAQSSKKEKILKELEESGYDEGPGASQEIVIKEGELLELAFRGNVKCTEETKTLEFVFNSQLTTSVYFEIEEVNKYLQRNYPTFRGFVQLFRKYELPKPPAEKREPGQEEEPEEPPVLYGKELLCEHLVNVPKEVEMLQSLQRAPVMVMGQNEAITDDTLRHLAVELGDEWQRVAHFLNIKKMRIQAILRNNMASSGREEEMKYDMLITWIKRVPKSLNKADILCNALAQGGRSDLAYDIREQVDNYKHRKQMDAQHA